MVKSEDLGILGRIGPTIPKRIGGGYFGSLWSLKGDFTWLRNFGHPFGENFWPIWLGPKFAYGVN